MLWKFLFGIIGPIAILGGIWFAVTRYYEHKGAAPYVAAHKQGLQDAKADTGLMSTSSKAIGAETAAQTASVASTVATAGREIDDEFKKPLGPVVAAPAFDIGSLSPSLNSVGDDARRAAALADAARGAG